jgi:glycosyltransferase involved in cell wall biosynthesis
MANILTIEEGPKLKTDFAINKMLEADVIVVHRPASEEWFKFIKKCREYGKIIVCDYDDDPFNTSPLNPYYQFIGTDEVMYQWSDGSKEMLWSKNPSEHGGRFLDIEMNIRRRDLFRASFRKADMVTTTTDILQKKLKEMNPNTVVLPNLIDFNLYSQVEMVKKNVRIGWQGGASHYEDLYMIAPAIKEILKKHRNTTFVYWGDMRMYGLFKDCPIGRVECHTWCKHYSYPDKLALLNLDIGLCPIINNEFNRNKSAIKYFEYSTQKIASVASNMPPYSPVIHNGEDGMLVDESEWFNAIDELVLNEDKRKKLGEKAFENIWENHNADKKVHLWAEAYQSLLKKDLVGV